MDGGAWWAAVHGVAKSWTRLSDFTFIFHFHALEKEMATHSSVLAWRIPGTAEPGGAFYGVAQSRTRLKRLSSSSSSKFEIDSLKSCNFVLFQYCFHCFRSFQFSSVQLLSHVRLFVTPWTAARQASLLLLLSHVSCVRLCATLTGAHQAPPSLGFSRQELWSGLPFPSPMHESEKWKWSRSVVSDSSDPMNCSPPGSSVHGIFQAKVLEWGAIAFSEFHAKIYKYNRLVYIGLRPCKLSKFTY